MSSNVQGSLDTLELRCQYQRVVDQAREGVDWVMPEDWGSCRVIVFGEKGTTFSLLERAANVSASL